MDLQEIRQVVELMQRYDLTEFEIEEENLKLRLNRHQPGAHPAPAAPFPFPAAATGAPFPATQVPNPAAPGDVSSSGLEGMLSQEEAESDLVLIKSPMVGTFYRAPSPESPSFVNPGDKVEENSVVCIVEAMKVMNEIQAEVRGEIVEALVENGASVEYAQPLFKVRPA